MSDFDIQVVVDAMVPSNTVNVTVDGNAARVIVSPEVKTTTLEVLEDSIAKAVIEAVEKKGGPGLLMASII